jgi:hypothetical protein
MTALATPTKTPTAQAELQAPVISLVPTTPEEIAEIGTQLGNMSSAITGHNGLGVMPLASTYKWNLSADFNVNWRDPNGGHPAFGHKPSCCERDLVVVWTPPPQVP